MRATTEHPLEEGHTRIRHLSLSFEVGSGRLATSFLLAV